MKSTLNDTYAINQLGSPGAQHFVGRSTTTATSATYAVVINEVGNNSQDSYDWIELRNTGTTQVNLQKWEITEITGADTETALVTFPNNDKHQIPAGGILLIVNSDPYRDPAHPLAAGTIINSDKLREEKTGINSRYYVDGGLKLRDDGKMALLVRNANDKEKQPTNVIDFTGPRPFNNIEDLTSKPTEPISGPSGHKVLVAPMSSKILLKSSVPVESISGITLKPVTVMILGVKQVTVVLAISVVLQVMEHPDILTVSSKRLRPR